MSANDCGGLNLGCMCIGWRGGEERVDAEKGGPRLLFFPFLLASVCWPLLTHDTNSYRSLQPNFSLLSSQSIQHREDKTADSEPWAASCISAEPFA